MMPYIIRQPGPNEDYRDDNIVIEFTSCDKPDLDKRIIMIEVMYEFCSKEYDNGIEMSS